MEEIITNTLSSLEVAEMLGMEHKLLLRKIKGRDEQGKHIKGIIDILNENQMVPDDFFILSSYIDTKGEPRPCYQITKMGCEFLGNKCTGERGILFTAKYVSRFNEMEQALQPKIPQTYAEALRLAADLSEQNEKLTSENQYLIGERKKDAVKVEFFNAVAGSKDALDIGRVAKILNYEGIGRNKMFEILRDAKILDMFNVPYQQYIKGNFFRVVESPYMVGYEKRVTTKTLVHQKGILLIKRTLDRLGYIMIPTEENKKYREG